MKEEHDKLEQQAKWFATAISAWIIQSYPQDITGAICAMWAFTATKIPDFIWDAMVAQCKIPCSSPDCNCEVQRQEVFAAWNKLREEGKRLMEGIEAVKGIE